MNKKIAVIADVHSNLHALIAVLKKINEYNVDDIIFLGDAVGYGGNPNEVCELLRKKCSISIVGNHDKVVCGKMSIVNFNYAAQNSVLITKEIISTENGEWLAALEENYQLGNIMFTHGALSDPNKYIDDKYSIFQEYILMKNRNIDILFCGHSHSAFFSDENNFSFIKKDQEIPFSQQRMIINPGSVGQPRDRNPDAGFIIMDFKQKNIQFLRVKYDITSAQKAILKIKMPDKFAYRLNLGR